MARIQGHEFPEHLFYDVENQIWYAPLPDGTLRTGFTAWAALLMGEVLVFTPKRLGHTFEKEHWFAMVEGGKWVGAARAAFDGIVIAQNELLESKPELLNPRCLREGLDVDRTTGARELARRSRYRCGDRADIRSMAVFRRVQRSRQLKTDRLFADAEGVLKLFDAARQGRLGHLAGFARPFEVFFARQCEREFRLFDQDRPGAPRHV